MFIEYLLCAKEAVPAMLKCGWEGGGQVAADEVVGARRRIAVDGFGLFPGELGMRR